VHLFWKGDRNEQRSRLFQKLIVVFSFFLSFFFSGRLFCFWRVWSMGVEERVN